MKRIFYNHLVHYKNNYVAFLNNAAMNDESYHLFFRLFFISFLLS